MKNYNCTIIKPCMLSLLSQKYLCLHCFWIENHKIPKPYTVTTLVVPHFLPQDFNNDSGQSPSEKMREEIHCISCYSNKTDFWHSFGVSCKINVKINKWYCSHQLAVLQIYVLDCAWHHKGTSEPVDVLKGLSCLAHDSTLRINEMEWKWNNFIFNITFKKVTS